MAIPNGIQTAALIAGTVIAASGLNLGVIGLGEADVTVEPADDGTQQAAVDPGAVNTGAVNTGAVAPGAGAIGASAADGDLVVSAAPAAEPEGPTGPALPVAAPAQPVASPTAPRSTQPSVAPTPIPTAAIPTTAQPTTARPTTAQPTMPPSQPATQPPMTQAPATQPPATQTEYLTYEFDGIADIVVALHDGDRLEFWSVARSPGWVSRVDDNGPGKVKVKFMRLSDGEEAEFEVRVGSDGDLDVKMEA